MVEDFVTESRTAESIRVRHVAHGHRYTFYVRPDARTLRLGPVDANTNTSLPTRPFQIAARAFAEREARKADLID
ncbi:hypothetical protein SAMN05519103_06430 [Rhizobiales bacterium GAS113]|nr:hypothetical protein SAMN05519103_06430 [Rhizobiales bacterium GAS113]